MSDEPIELHPNAFAINASPYEVYIELLQVTPDMSAGAGQQAEPVQRVLGRLRLAPSVAKALVPFLLQQVRDVERQFGTIPVLGDVDELWAALGGDQTKP